jgi:hypothetical protein
MSTPITPVTLSKLISTADTELPTAIAQTTSWFKVHETLLIVLMALLVGTFVVYKYFDLAAAIENHRAEHAQATLVAQTQKDAATLAQAKEALTSYQVTIAQTLAANSALSTAMATRDKTVIIQQTADAKLPPTQLATRWQGLIADSGVTPNTTGYSLTDSAGIATIEQLEQVPVLQLDLQDETSKATNLQSDVDKANVLVADGKNLVGGLQTQIKAQTKADAATLAAEKADSRKGKMKWFGIGFASGFVAGVTVHIW